MAKPSSPRLPNLPWVESTILTACSVTSEAKVVVTGMAPGPVAEAISRAVAIPQDNPDVLFINRGLDTPDIDNATAFIDNSKGMIQAFDLTNMPADGYDYTTDGTVFSWADGITRNGVPLTDNPGDEFNCLGKYDAFSTSPPPNPGYPFCHTSWNVSSLPDSADLSIGTGLLLDASVHVDSFCAENSIPPRISFLTHTAPLGIAFYKPETPSSGKDLVGSAFVSLPGPAGHSIVVVPFKDGEPAAPADSGKGYYDFVWTSPSVNKSQCRSALLQAPAGIGCLSPVGLVFDKRGRLYFTADVTGEVFVVTKDQPEDCSGD
ncbi:hypothetical protein SAICODRAFT_225502 [Saitoella complicata NRRL Y-17804]|uniref:uncharacterized protein n=1 Tax=Saitoella complicata (strain BCRC 22490 / CBS 7301 / JCM 7358 / NBRC 10748 / NRRL Y-17804) TaxID=698492 RepID=UPI000867C73C|nr:uncharacterized protein SAICODRAFT_225502 [Saitoella complicata NRRL Y-17804]ODQ53256.1 hypothetical protein SAICODRAFT_225502 [Saitoella complicata NRRL Y-17804]